MPTSAYHPVMGMDPELFVMGKRNKRHATSAHLIELTPRLKTPIYDDGETAPYHYADYNDVEYAHDNWRELRACQANDCYSDPCEIGVHFKKDGAAVELNSDPSYCRDWLIPSTAAALREFYEELPGYKLSALPKMPLTAESLNSNPPEDVLTYGCQPDFNAYTLSEKTPPTRGYHTNERYTGGHIHLQVEDRSYDASPYVIQQPNEEFLYKGCSNLEYYALHTIACDIAVGVPVVAMLGNTNNYGEADRRFYYGQAGSFRPKPYGFEYRVLSGAMLMSPYLFGWVLGQIREAIKYTNMANGKYSGSLDTRSWWLPNVSAAEQLQAFHDAYDLDEVQRIINEHDVDAARLFCERFADDLNFNEHSSLSQFLELVVKADKQGVGFNTNLFDSWMLDQDFIFNHHYAGVDNLMKFSSYVIMPTVEQLPILDILPTAPSWAYS